MPEQHQRQLPGTDLPELLNPTFIARLASRLFNEFPGAGEVPGNEQELQEAPHEAERLTLEHAGLNGKPVEFGEPSWNPDHLWFPGETPAAEGPRSFYFLPDGAERKEEPLEPHAERLTEQQTYTANSNGSYGLEEQLNRPASSQKIIPAIEARPETDQGETISFDFLKGIVLPSLQEMQGINQGKCLVEELFQKAGNTLVNPQEPLVAPRDGFSSPLHAPGSFYFFEQLPKPQAQREIFDVASVRRDFPILGQQVHGRPLVWLDNAATTQKPLSVIEAISQFYATDNSNIHRGAHTLAARATDAYEGAREKIRRFINAGSTSEIVYVRGTTEAINLVAQTWGRSFIQPGDEILLSILEHHANIVPWQMLAQEKGAIIRVIPVDENGEILLEEYTRLLGPRTRLVSITQASNGLGTILPVREMIRLARRHNATVLVDGAQSVAHLPVDVQDLDADFFVFSGHKIFAPTGIGVLYGKRELLESMPPWQGGGNMIRDVRFDRTLYNEPPAKFEAGTPSIADAVGLGAALDYVRKLGLENIARYEHELTRYATRQLSAIPGIRLIGTAREKVGVLSFVLDGVPNDEVGRLLDREGIAVRTGHHCTQPSLRRFGVEGTVRPSLAFYNTTGEIDRLVDVVRRLRRS